MCGRYTLTVPEGALVEAFDVPALTFDHRPRFNVAPGQSCPVVAEDRAGRRMGLLEWGFLPRWKDDPTGPFINARSESAHSKTSFAEAMRRRRCLVPADGFYEWKAEGGVKHPFWIYPSAGGVLSFAGIWETWSRAGSEDRHTFAILTTGANEEVSEVHDRMPVVVPTETRSTWLRKDASPEAIRAILRPAPSGTFSLRRVSNRVNRPTEDDESLLAPVDA